MPKLVIGFITYNDLTAKYLPYFLQSLKEQTFQDFQLLVFDNSEAEMNANADFLASYPKLEYLRVGENIGFAQAYNLLLARAAEIRSEYFLAINPDVILEQDAVRLLIEGLSRDKVLGSVSPKVLKWDFEKNIKTDIIDTCGIVLRPGLLFIDSGQGERDSAKYHDDFAILGPSGACALYRMDVLKKIMKPDGYFDGSMFMYKEDVDLAYRLFLEGYGSMCVASSLAYHDRTASGTGEGNFAIAANRKNKSRTVKEWSFLNQQMIFIKYWNLQDWKNKLLIIWYEIRVFVFIALFERYLLKQLIKLRRVRENIKKF
jgi:GT2 family glycosyltransferase